MRLPHHAGPCLALLLCLPLPGRAELPAPQLGTEPRYHGQLRLDLPRSRWHAGMEASALNLGDSQLRDVRAHVGYRVGDRLELRAGWRRQRVTLQGMDDVDAEQSLGGPYVGLSFAF
ncbi:hypothetical protein [Alkalilimnicola sp. S0819]|uniref:hypothetical protein n=1 Tax=Alkalilimnicola sp. S0819 TaxID=2613922 RepID=UPI0012625C7A|nr:hypothetical protein [Alkalilimnicola sp. S0819]KAB7624188.1 hypothetical protein F3N43_07310 [Alkalilimnicola sp. S0819]MPQ16443.1 hypothetical protein [Alkalilimnicola sp. S0819]